LLYSCKKDPKIDKSLLPGKWAQGTLFERYFSDGNGYTWDESDDVKEEEAQKFTWTLDKNNLTQIHIGEMGQQIPKSYTVTELTSTSFKYKDDYGKNCSFSKVE
jgi:hypothetical protein